MDVKNQWQYQNQDQDANPSKEPPASSKIKTKTIWMTLALSKIKIHGQNSEHWYIKTSDLIQIKIKMPNPSKEPPASSKVPNKDLKDLDILCAYKIKIESQNLDHGCIKDQWPYPNQDQDAEPKSGASSILKAPNMALMDRNLLHTFKIKIKRQNLDHGCIKDHWPYPKQDQYSKSQLGASCVLKIPNQDLHDINILWPSKSF